MGTSPMVPSPGHPMAPLPPTSCHPMGAIPTSPPHSHGPTLGLGGGADAGVRAWVLPAKYGQCRGASLSHRGSWGGPGGALGLTHCRRQPLYSLGRQRGHVTPSPPWLGQRLGLRGGPRGSHGGGPSWVLGGTHT